MRLASRCDIHREFSHDTRLRPAYRRPALFHPAFRDEAGNRHEIAGKSAP